MLWNTRYMDAALAHLRESGYPVRDEDVGRLSPLGDSHLNLVGRYSFGSAPAHGLRPLRQPDDDDPNAEP